MNSFFPSSEGHLGAFKTLRTIPQLIFFPTETMTSSGSPTVHCQPRSVTNSLEGWKEGTNKKIPVDQLIPLGNSESALQLFQFPIVLCETGNPEQI
jgi:hypothetical protein